MASILKGDIQLKSGGSHTICAQLIADAHSPDANAHDFRNDLTANDATNCVEETVTVADPDVSTSNLVRFDLTNTTVVFETVSTTVVGGAYFFRKQATTTLSNLICLNDLASNVTANGSNIQLNITNGYVFKITVGA